MRVTAQCIFHKMPLLLELCRGKTVLNLGCVNHTVEAIDYPSFQHGALAKVTKQLVGIDYEPAGVLELQKRGYDVRVGDAQSLDLTDEFPDGFDVVVASERIEHLSNTGLFLDVIRRHLTAEGILVRTTPHAYGIAFCLEIAVFGEERINDDHTATFSRKNIAHLLGRHGLEVVDFYWLNQDISTLSVHKTWMLQCLARLFFYCQLPFIFFRRGWSKEMIVIAKRKDAHSSAIRS